MVKNFLLTGKAILTGRQGTILSAALTIMIMVAASRVLGLVRQRVLAHFFSVEDLAVYFAAFRFPEMIFEILVVGALSSAFIPVFSSYISRGQEKKGWYVAAISQNAALFIFALLAVFIFIFAEPLSQLITPGFPAGSQAMMAQLTRLLLFVQGFFILSFFLTGVLESHQRFLLPAIAPLFYNLGIIFGAASLSSLGVWGAAIGALVGAFLHFAIQLPLALSLGFRFVPKIDFRDPGFRSIAKLAAPRALELSAYQILKSIELVLASLISLASYTYYTFANTLQLVPVGLFGVSVAKASLPTLSSFAAKGQMEKFRQTFGFALTQILFFVLPMAILLAVLRIPLVRILFGTARFSWEATVQTGYVVSAFSLGVTAQSIVALFTRAFYALQDTKTPVKVSLFSILVNIAIGAFLVLVLRLDVWSLALAISIAYLLQATLLFLILDRRIQVATRQVAVSAGKIVLASFASGGVMFFLLKILDRSAWDKKLSFLGKFGLALPTSFESFVLDTRYTANLIFLTLLVAGVGALVYLLLAALLRLSEMDYLFGIVRRLLTGKIPLPPAEPKEVEPVSPPPAETS